MVVKNHFIFQVVRENDQYLVKQGIAKSFYSYWMQDALQEAQQYGEVLTLPEVLEALGLSSFQGFLAEVPVTVQTEEIIGKTKAGNAVAIVVHGKGLLTPQRIIAGTIIEKIVDNMVPDHGLTHTVSGKGQFALPLEREELTALLAGNIVPLYSYSGFTKESNLPREYAIVRDLDLNTEVLNGDYSFTILKKIPRLISLAGGQENLENCFDLWQVKLGGERMHYSHTLHYLDLNQPQGRLMEVHGARNLFYSFREMGGPARFVAVNRENLEERIDKEVTIEI
ncbi:MAG TPA: hypothetical protein VJB13_04825 [Candidatus Nanoarchaeia archaeon]|nr:hypothetical protein [Candidatus Nanoarchaeia archaeon]